jgi:serine kinase of HPr protein (carbohydrate metabolism regulator)
MKEVDHLGWEVGFSLKSYGVRIGIRSNDPKALESACEHLPSEWERISSPLVDRVYSIMIGSKGARGNRRRQSQLYGNEVQLANSTDLDVVFETLESDLRLFVAELATHRVFVHAGVVGWKGHAIVIPGRSYSGKSTLVAELVRAGATYYSDEFAVLDARGRVHPFSKPLELREEGEFRQTKITVAELGGHSGTTPLPVRLVLMTQFKSGARWRPRKLTTGRGVLEMLFNTVSARRSPKRALATLQRVAAQADVLKGVRGNAAEVVASLLKRVERS